MSDQLSSDLASLRIQRDIPPDRSGVGRYVAALLVVSALGAGAVLGYPKLKSTLYKTEISITEIALISPAQASINVTSTGYVVPQTVARLSAKVPGRIARVRVKEGDTVKAGQVIAELEDAESRASVASAEARVASAKARALAARANALELKPQIERESALVDKGVRGRALLEDLTARSHALEETARAVEAEVNAAKAEVESLRVLLRDRTIVAPIEGTVITKPPEVGELAGPTVPLVEIADFRSLAVETDVPEARLGLVRIGAPCEIVLDANTGKRHRGVAFEIGKRVNRAKATVLVKVRFQDDTEGILPEMAARVSFLSQELPAEAMKEPPKRVVPASALAERAGAKVVFVVDQGRIRLTPVTVGAQLAGGFELTSGPVPGTRVVASPEAGLEDGQRIKEKERAD